MRRSRTSTPPRTSRCPAPRHVPPGLWGEGDLEAGELLDGGCASRTTVPHVRHLVVAAAHEDLIVRRVDHRVDRAVVAPHPANRFPAGDVPEKYLAVAAAGRELRVVLRDAGVAHLVAVTGVRLDQQPTVGVPQTRRPILHDASRDEAVPAVPTFPQEMQYEPWTLNRTARTGPSWPRRPRMRVHGSSSSACASESSRASSAFEDGPSSIVQRREGELEPEVRCDSHRPTKLLQQRVGVDLLDRHLVALAPGDGDAGVEVVDLGRPEGDGLQALLVLHLHLDLLPLGRLLLAALLQNGELLLVPGAGGAPQVADRVVDLADLLFELGDLLRQALDLVVVGLGHRPLVVAQDRHLRTRTSVPRGECGLDRAPACWPRRRQTACARPGAGRRARPGAAAGG